MKYNILVTLPKGGVFDTFFNEDRIQELEALGNVEWNESTKQFTEEELRSRLRDKDICVTGWGSPIFTEAVLAGANRLKLIAHTAGSVKPYVTDAVYEQNIRVVSGNRVFARSVAESVIAYALTSLRDIVHYSTELKKGNWRPGIFANKGLLNRSVGIVGYGMISRYVVKMLQPFDTTIKVFSRHIDREELDRWHMTQADLPEIFKTCDIISIHSGMTMENYHLITEELLRMMKPGALLINTARGAVIDEAALVKVLNECDIHAVLDVYEKEPLSKGHPLLGCDRAILMPHMGGPTIDQRLYVTKAVIEDIASYISGGTLTCEIDKMHADKMTAPLHLPKTPPVQRPVA